MYFREFYIKQTKIITVHFITFLINFNNNGFLPFEWQFFLLPNDKTHIYIELSESILRKLFVFELLICSSRYSYQFNQQLSKILIAVKFQIILYINSIHSIPKIATIVKYLFEFHLVDWTFHATLSSILFYTYLLSFKNHHLI